MKPILLQDSLDIDLKIISLRLGLWFHPFQPYGSILAFCGGIALGYIPLNTTDWETQLFSSTGLVFLGTLVGLIAKPSILWTVSGFFTVLSLSLCFLADSLIASLNPDLNYTVSWLASIGMSTTLVVFFYILLRRMGLNTLTYTQTLLENYVWVAFGNILALGFLSYFNPTLLFFVIIGGLTLHKTAVSHLDFLLNPWVTFNRGRLRPLYLGFLAIGVDYIALTPFYILEMLLTLDPQDQRRFFLCPLQQIRRKMKNQNFFTLNAW